ncbi:hypothetical protein GCM10022285_22240 [Streptomyces tunisiensis]|uniref:Uncharacterized protein n=1 Tax=Streptomyces tunisiensis TaxID=948699 RepID=A0ABP7Y911_9ACTN
MKLGVVTKTSSRAMAAMPSKTAMTPPNTIRNAAATVQLAAQGLSASRPAPRKPVPLTLLAMFPDLPDVPERFDPLQTGTACLARHLGR